MSRYSRIMLALVAGVAIAILIAWAAAIWSPLDFDAKWITARNPPPQLPVEIPEALLARANGADNIPLEFEYLKCSGPGVRFDQCLITDRYDPQATRFSYTLYNATTDYRVLYSWTAGWPLPCVQGFVTRDQGRPSEDRGPWVIPAPKLNPPWRTKVWWYRPQGAYLPCRPLAVGFAVDTLIYAAAAFVVARTTFGCRAALRRRRGLCPRCAYDRRALVPEAPCPECGAPAPRTLTAPAPAPSPAPPPPAEPAAAPHSPSP